MRALWLADEIRKQGAKVVEYPGWQYVGGELIDIRGWFIHHTASYPRSDPNSDITLIWKTGFLVPEYNVYISRTGLCYVGASGLCNHAGFGGNNGLSSSGRKSISWLPSNSANAHTIGIVMANTGIGEIYPDVQQDAVLAVCRAVNKGAGCPNSQGLGHQEWTRRKIDPAGSSRWAVRSNMWNMDEFRKSVESSSPLTEDEDEMVKALVQVKGDSAVWLYVNGFRFWMPDWNAVEVAKYLYDFKEIHLLDPAGDLRSYGVVTGPMPSSGTDKRNRDVWGVLV